MTFPGRRALSRRRFLAASACALAALPGCAGTRMIQGSVQDGFVHVLLDEHPEIDRPGAAVLVRTDGRIGPIVLIREGEGYRALAATCTHLGCTVRPSGSFLACPCHGSTYDLGGRVTRGPAAKPLYAFDVRVVGRRLEIRVP